MPDLLYIDPAGGSLIMQVIIAAIASILVFFKNIKAFLVFHFKNFFGKKNDK